MAYVVAILTFFSLSSRSAQMAISSGALMLLQLQLATDAVLDNNSRVAVKRATPTNVVVIAITMLLPVLIMGYISRWETSGVNLHLFDQVRYLDKKTVV
jgi:hypothetical protein